MREYVRDYLYPPRPGKTRFWQLRLPHRSLMTAVDGDLKGDLAQIRYVQKPSGRASVKEISTRCESYEKALIFALPLIRDFLQHQQIIRDTFATSGKLRGTIEGKVGLEPNESLFNEDGSRTTASSDGTVVVEFNSLGQILGSRRNNSFYGFKFTGNNAEHKAIREIEQRIKTAGGTKPAADMLDNLIFANWRCGGFGTKGKVQTSAIVNDAKLALDRFHSVAMDKNLATAEAKDARAFVRLLIDNDHSTGSMDKQVGHLKAMTNTVIKTNKSCEGNFPKIDTNFWTIQGLVPQGYTGKRSRPTLFTPSEEEAIFSDLPNWGWQERLLWTFLFYTGARVGEPFQVTSEEDYRGFRCLRYGSKTPESTARLVTMCPQLDALLPHRITGPIFENGQEKIVFDTMERVRALKVGGVKFAEVGTGRTLASLRARFITLADDRGRGVNKDVIKAITGHVPDSLGSNETEIMARKRDKKGVWWRYMRGNHPRRLLEVMEWVAPLRTDDDF